jgi:hypothetical protein
MHKDLERISMPKGYGLLMVVVLALACIAVLLWVAKVY